MTTGTFIQFINSLKIVKNDHQYLELKNSEVTLRFIVYKGINQYPLFTSKPRCIRERFLKFEALYRFHLIKESREIEIID